MSPIETLLRSADRLERWAVRLRVLGALSIAIALLSILLMISTPDRDWTMLRFPLNLTVNVWVLGMVGIGLRWLAVVSDALGAFLRRVE